MIFQIPVTGINFTDHKTGVIIADKENIFSYKHEMLAGNYYGAGDLFTAVFVGKFLNCNDLSTNVKTACNFVKEAIKYTVESHWYGIQFKKILGKLDLN